MKGPQGALHGRNAVSGAILVTQKPGDEAEAEIAVGLGKNNAVKARAVVSGPVGDNMAGRIAVSTRETDGFYGNSFTGGNGTADYLEDTSARTRLVWNVSDDLELDFRAGYTDVSGGAINFNAAFAIPAFEAALEASFLQTPTTSISTSRLTYRAKTSRRRPTSRSKQTTPWTEWTS